MEQEVLLRIILEKPPADIDYGLQNGSGSNYETILKQRSKGHDLFFDFAIKVRGNKENNPTFAGPFVQGPADSKFVYINIGASAGQTNTQWNRRLKIPLIGITEDTIRKVSADRQCILETKVPGTGKDGSPTCATVKLFGGWKVVKR
jgi:hypothetical protein